MSKKELKDRLKEEMDLQGLKQVDLVSIGHFDKGQLSAWLSGRYKPKQENIDKLSRILGVSEAWLMGFDAPKNRTDDLDSIVLSPNEKTLIEKYRSTDDRGRHMIDYIADVEYQRAGVDAIALAAHHETGNFTEQQKDKIREFVEMSTESDK